jgi:phosphopantothenoylcysteine decarboxylase/phosphopantothenate--cysteine ligase
MSWAGKKVLLGLSGGIAAYKGPALVRELTKQGAQVRVVVTRAAAHFVTPLSLQIMSGHPVGTDLFDPAFEATVGHIELARWPDAVLVAPTTADLLAKVRLGMCDDLLTTVLCATTAPIVLAPAMNTQMWRNPAVQENVAALRARWPRVHLVEPDAGDLACGEVGEGRLPDPPVLLEAVARAWTPQLLEGKRALVTAGPTHEFIDPVRFLSNPSTGKMGFALARVAARMGARVTLVAGPVQQPTPPSVQRLNVTSAQEMYEAVMAQVAPPGAVGRMVDVVAKSAAVADWKAAAPSDQKVKKTPGDASVALARTKDILAELGGLDPAIKPLLMGFAAETNDLRAYALDKLARKRVDMIVANRVTPGASAFGADDNAVTVFDRAGGEVSLGPAPKEEVAAELWRHAAALAGWGV